MIYSNTQSKLFEVPQTVSDPNTLKISGQDKYGYKKEVYLNDLSTVFIGAPGFGKTTQIVKLVDQISNNKDAVTIILDIKGEYLKNCFSPGDLVLSYHNIQDIPVEAQVRWSLMKEAVIDPHPEEVLMEIAKILFSSAIETSQSPAFPTAAMLVFYGEIVYILRSCNRRIPFNEQLIKTMMSLSNEQIHNALIKYKDLLGFANLISKKENVTSYGVKMELLQVLTETFTPSNFCASKSDFSIREFIRKGKGHKLFIEYDFQHRESVGNIIRILLDLAMKESISYPDLYPDDQTRYWFILDEYAFLPSGLTYLDAVKEVGRSKGARVIGGFQNIEQLMKIYSNRQDMAMDDFGSFSNVIVLKPHDHATIETVQRRCGMEMNQVMTVDTMCNVFTESKLVPVVDEAVLTSLGLGEAVILPNAGRPFWIRLDK